MARLCASCNGFGRLVCNGCAKAPAYLDDQAPLTYYCSSECQKSHWPKHKDRCKALQNRKILHRAVKVIQSLYETILRASFIHTIEKLDRIDDDTLFIHLTTSNFDGKNTRIPGVPPGSVSSNNLEELAALTAYGCTNAVAIMGPTIQTMLEDVGAYISESQIIPLNRKLWGVIVHVNGEFEYNSENVDQHEVFLIVLFNPRIPMQDQERYALDLTHFQYGHHDETLMPWKTYVEDRVRSNSGQRPLGWTKEKSLKMMVEQFGQEGFKIQTIANDFEQVLTAAIREIPGWIKLWKEPKEDAYIRQIKNVTEHVATRLGEFLAAKANDKDYRIWSSPAHKRLMEANAKRIRKEKLESWGKDYRSGPTFKSAIGLVKARQAKERAAWGTPEEEKNKVNNFIVNTSKGTDFSNESQAQAREEMEALARKMAGMNKGF
ncbi:MAG: hypothetical protein Q9209_002651 [Squamulea sp. 1 TL-2023]